MYISHKLKIKNLILYNNTVNKVMFELDNAVNLTIFCKNSENGMILHARYGTTLWLMISVAGYSWEGQDWLIFLYFS